MANIKDPTAEEQHDWDMWVSERPTPVRLVLQKYELSPWQLYRLKSSGHRVTLHSVQEPEDGSPPTLTVDVLGRYNLVAFDRRVFGVNPEDLEECDLPSDKEPLGTVLSEDEVGHAVDGLPPGEPRVQAIRDAAMRSIQERAPKGDA